MSRFLFYVEPFPIRNQFTHFQNVINDNFGMALLDNQTEHEYYIYANKPTLLQMEKINAEYANHFIIPTKDETALFEDCWALWDDEGINKWKKLMSQSPLSNTFKNMIRNIHKRCPFDYICCWGTNYAVQAAAKELRIGFIDMELGCSRKPYFDSLAIDPWGVNGSASISKSMIDDFADIPVSDAKNDLLFVNGLDSTAYESQFTYLNNSAILNKISVKKLAYVALQLYDDANLLQYAPYNTVEEVLMNILPDLKKAGYTCIIKEHPLSAQRPGSNFANIKAKVYALGFDNVIWLTAQDVNISNSVLYRISDVVITTNSSVGFEALFFEKPVVVLGDAVYKVGGVFPTLKEFLAHQFNPEQYTVQIGKIRNFFLNYYLFPKIDATKSTRFFPFLKFVGDMSKKEMTTKEIIEAYYKQKEGSSV